MNWGVASAKEQFFRQWSNRISKEDSFFKPLAGPPGAAESQVYEYLFEKVTNVVDHKKKIGEGWKFCWANDYKHAIKKV